MYWFIERDSFLLWRLDGMGCSGCSARESILRVNWWKREEGRRKKREGGEKNRGRRTEGWGGREKGGEREDERGRKREGGGEKEGERERRGEKGRRKKEKHWSLDQCTILMRLLLCSTCSLVIRHAIARLTQKRAPVIPYLVLLPLPTSPFTLLNASWNFCHVVLCVAPLVTFLPLLKPYSHLPYSH